MMTTGSHHAEWLGLLEISGPFLSLPVLERAFPQGLDAHDPDHSSKLRLAREEWAEEQSRKTPDPELHDLWIEFVLSETLEFTPEVLHKGSLLGDDFVSSVDEYGEVLRPDFILTSPGSEGGSRRASLLIAVHRADQDLNESIDNASWAAPPIARMTYLCRSLGVRLGLVTNGEHWVLVDAPTGETAAHVSWYASLWSLEPLTLRAFRSLLGVKRFFGVADPETLEGMLAESVSYQGEVTEQLGAQVRRAVEVLVQSLDRADADSGRKLLTDVTESELYEAAITVMMRLVFLFFAEENDLLPLGDRLYQENYAASTLQGQLREEADRVGVEVLERRQDAWIRLLSTFRAIYGGIEHEALRLPPYGGSLFNPDRFCFLEGRSRSSTWREVAAQPLPVDNRTVLHLLDALQILQMRGRSGLDARKLSFRGLDIEQIGHVYEMLLDHEVMRAPSLTLGLVGAGGQEPEVALQTLDEVRREGFEQLLDFLQSRTKKSRPTLKKSLTKGPDAAWLERLKNACQGNEDLLDRVLPYQDLIRTDPWGEPIVIREGSVFVTGGSERRTTGTYYTPRSLTEEIVSNALEPLAYDGPAEGLQRSEWRLGSATELLKIRVCDPAMGSGAFLVQVVRWLAERLVEAWERAGPTDIQIRANEGMTNSLQSVVDIPGNPAERLALARRLVADQCVYGVDVNPLAVEMAKLSLWLITLARNRPFSFLDHALRCGNSLLGVTELGQVEHLHLDPSRGRAIHTSLFGHVEKLQESVATAIARRQSLESFPVLTLEDARQKNILLGGANQALDPVRVVADLVVGAALIHTEEDSSAIDEELIELSENVAQAFDLSFDESARQDAFAALDARAESMLGSKGSPGRRLFHWPLEFPEAFLDGGFHAVVGNPPFLGGVRVSEVLGDSLNTYLARLFPPFSKRVDLSARFIRRAAGLVRDQGAIGSLATNTISQGQTRKGGLDVVTENGWSIYRAAKSFPWPGAAAVIASAVWLYRGEWKGTRVCSGEECTFIDTLLEPLEEEESKPQILEANRSRCFQGPTIWGEDFIITAELAAELIGADSRNRDVVRRFMGGRELNTSLDFSPNRWVVAMGERNEEQAARYELPFAYLERAVKPWRQSLDPKKYRRVVNNWWKFFHARADLFGGIRDLNLSRVLARARVSDFHMVAFIDTDIVYSDQLIVFLYDDWNAFATIQSSVHEVWARKYSSTLKSDVRYQAADCFYTFPMPLRFSAPLAARAQEFYEHRSNLMLKRDLGMTQLYREFHRPNVEDSDTLELRRLLEALDIAVLASYGWDDLHPEHGFHETATGLRYTLSTGAKSEILRRLSRANLERSRSAEAPPRRIRQTGSTSQPSQPTLKLGP